MRFMKYTFPIALILLFALAAAACAQAPDVATGGGTTATATTGSAAALIHTASVSVKGTSKTVLTNAQGLTLYYFTPDDATTSKCTGGCAGTWPALVATGSGAPTSSPALSGTLEAHTTPNGNQVQYNKHFLYMFSGDSAAGQANGEGISGKWFVATPDLK